MRTLLIPLLLLTGTAFAGDGLPAGANAMCPVMTDDAAEPDYVVEHGGKKVYLCCKKCVKKFKADPEKYMKVLAEMESKGAAPAGDTPKK